ncbi:MAG: S49 family peptidase [Pseudomonadota bacterium]
MPETQINRSTVAATIRNGQYALDWQAFQAMPLALEAQPSAVARLAAMRGRSADGGAETWLLERGVAIVPVHGLLMREPSFISAYFGWSTYRGLRQAAAEIAARDDVNAVVLHISSPGGQVSALRETYQAFAALDLPRYAVVEGFAASAAYWIAAAAGDITMPETDAVGSIGIMARGYDPVAPDFEGLQGWVIRSSNAAGKNPDGTTEDGATRIRADLDTLEAMFHADVAAGRGMTVEAIIALEGRTMMAAEAIAAGLADRMGDPDARLDEIIEDYGTAEAGGQPVRRRAASARARANVAAARLRLVTS